MAISIHSASSVLAFGLVACIASQPAPAATASASFGVSATVQASCGVSFRPDPAATTGVTSAVSVTCSHAVSYNVSVSPGRSTTPTLVPLETEGPDPAVVRSARLPIWANSPNGHTISKNTAIETENGSAQWLPIDAQTVETRSLASPANAGLIVVTVTY